MPVTVSNGTDTLTTPIYLPEQIRKVGDEAEYIDYGEQKQHRVRKNLLQNTATSQEINGVTFTVNSDGSVTCNGTATAITTLAINIGEILNGIYIVSGCPNNGAYNTYRIDIRTSGNTTLEYNSEYVVDTGNGHLFDSTDAHSAVIRINTGYTCDNLTFYPMIRLATIEDDTYEPYIENTELDVALPEIPALAGTNTLSVGTNVQPSVVEINGMIKAVQP